MVLKRLEGAAAIGSVAAFFDGWDETLLWSALEGEMGSVWTLDGSAAACVNGDFWFLGGAGVEALAKAVLARMEGRFAIIAANTPAQHEALARALGGHACLKERYAFYKGGEAFDAERLRGYAEALDGAFSLRLIDRELYSAALENEWSRDFVSQFSTAEDFLARGLGVVALYRGEMVGGASSYIRYSKGIEIEVDTRRDMRRRGVARACSARLILECQARGLYPSWDAANRESAALAQSLGYRLKGPYRVFHINEG